MVVLNILVLLPGMRREERQDLENGWRNHRPMSTAFDCHKVVIPISFMVSICAFAFSKIGPSAPEESEQTASPPRLPAISM